MIVKKILTTSALYLVELDTLGAQGAGARGVLSR